MSFPLDALMRRSLRAFVMTAFAAGASAVVCKAQTYPQLGRADFTPVVASDAPIQKQGFGDRQNSWAWSSAWYKGKLVIGTNRSYDCMVQAALNRGLGFVPYPPLDTDELCTPNYRDLPLRAEIWTWTPATNIWTRVFQSPQDVPIPDAIQKTVARDVGFRYMFTFTEPDGTEALYISGLSSRFIYGAGTSPARLLRTTDLVNFTAVPAPPGTVLGDIANAGFRGMTSYKGKFYIIGGSIEGNGVVLESANPKLGGNSFRVITRPGELASEIDVFNGYLYLSLSDDRGFRVVKTNAIESSPGAGYNFIEVIPFGGGRTNFPNRDVWSMRPFKNRLYIGGNGVASFFGAELYRINPDDTWDLVSGEPRTVKGILKTPISGLGPGFGWMYNAHMWRQAVFDERLYIGTFDMSTIFKDVPLLNLFLSGSMGGDLWGTSDGVYFYPIEQQGFQDKFNFGFRILQPTPYGLFLGTANYWQGLEIYLGKPRGFVPPSPTVAARTFGGFAAAGADAETPARVQRVLSAPQRLDVELNNGRVLLSWERTGEASLHRVFRSTYVMTDSPELRKAGAPGPVWIPGEAVEIGTTAKGYFVDSTMDPSARYLYFVQSEDGRGTLSAKSNLVSVPEGAIQVTMKSVADQVENHEQPSGLTTSQYEDAVQAAVDGNARPLTELYRTFRSNSRQSGAIAREQAAQDLEIALGRLLKRFEMFYDGHLRLGDL